MYECLIVHLCMNNEKCIKITIMYVWSFLPWDPGTIPIKPRLFIYLCLYGSHSNKIFSGYLSNLFLPIEFSFC